MPGLELEEWLLRSYGRCPTYVRRVHPLSCIPNCCSGRTKRKPSGSRSGKPCWSLCHREVTRSPSHQPAPPWTAGCSIQLPLSSHPWAWLELVRLSRLSHAELWAAAQAQVPSGGSENLETGLRAAAEAPTVGAGSRERGVHSSWHGCFEKPLVLQ